MIKDGRKISWCFAMIVLWCFFSVSFTATVSVIISKQACTEREREKERESDVLKDCKKEGEWMNEARHRERRMYEWESLRLRHVYIVRWLVWRCLHAKARNKLECKNEPMKCVMWLGDKASKQQTNKRERRNEDEQWLRSLFKRKNDAKLELINGKLVDEVMPSLMLYKQVKRQAWLRCRCGSWNVVEWTGNDVQNMSPRVQRCAVLVCSSCSTRLWATIKNVDMKMFTFEVQFSNKLDKKMSMNEDEQAKMAIAEGLTLI